jgi:hypothetical protein
MRSIVSASCTSGPVYGVGAGFPTYSGRGMSAGTERMGVGLPGTRIAITSECSRRRDRRLDRDGDGATTARRQHGETGRDQERDHEWVEDGS